MQSQETLKMSKNIFTRFLREMGKFVEAKYILLKKSKSIICELGFIPGIHYILPKLSQDILPMQ